MSPIDDYVGNLLLYSWSIILAELLNYKKDSHIDDILVFRLLLATAVGYKILIIQ